MSKHTPGPWMVSSNGAAVVDTATHGQELIIVQERGVDSEANARLIAAAPELLEAAIRAEELLSSVTDIASELAPFQNTALRLLRAAIAKAGGE